MNVARRMLRGVVALAIAACAVAPASATTLMRASLDNLVAGNDKIVVGEVLDVNSYWNANHDFILTDVTLAVNDVIKGQVDSDQLTVTIMGGTVGDITTLIVGGAELIPGRAYVLFLNNEQLPGTADALTVRDLAQGAFDVKMTRNGLRAVSQANQHPLVPDALGYLDAPGGVEGMPLGAMLSSIRQIANGTDQREVN